MIAGEAEEAEAKKEKEGLASPCSFSEGCLMRTEAAAKHDDNDRDEVMWSIIMRKKGICTKVGIKVKKILGSPNFERERES